MVRRIVKEIVLDADLPRRLRGELVARGMRATTLAELKIDGLLDDPMLAALSEKRHPAGIVLVTADDKMPRDHGDNIRRLGFTVATIDGRWQGKGFDTQDQWNRDTVHRWAHRMNIQAEKEIRRYSPARQNLWAARSR